MRTSVTRARKPAVSTKVGEPTGPAQVQRTTEVGACSTQSADRGSSGEPTTITAAAQDAPPEVDREGDFELHEMMYGPGGAFLFDSDDIEEMIATGQVWLPS